MGSLRSTNRFGGGSSVEPIPDDAEPSRILVLRRGRGEYRSSIYASRVRGPVYLLPWNVEEG
jgi:hypothetical protein